MQMELIINTTSLTGTSFSAAIMDWEIREQKRKATRVEQLSPQAPDCSWLLSGVGNLPCMSSLSIFPLKQRLNQSCFTTTSSVWNSLNRLTKHYWVFKAVGKGVYLHNHTHREITHTCLLNSDHSTTIQEPSSCLQLLEGYQRRTWKKPCAVALRQQMLTHRQSFSSIQTGTTQQNNNSEWKKQCKC